MIGRSLFGGLGVALVLCPAPSHAQKVHSTQDRMTTPGAPSARSIARSDELLRRTLKCVLKRAPSKARSLLESAPGSDEEYHIARSFQSRRDWCFPTGESIGFAYNVFRGALAEEMYRTEFPQGVTAASSMPAETLAVWTAPRTTGGGKPEFEYLHAAARCLVTKQTMGVAALLSTESLTREEAASFRSLEGALSSCLDSGVKFTASRQSLRGLLAEAMLEYGSAQKKGFTSLGASRTPALGNN